MSDLVVWIKCLGSVELTLWGLKVVIMLQAIEGQKALGFDQKYFHLFSENKLRSYGFGLT